MKKICWVTADYFIDVDFPVLKYINKDFDIDWILVNSFKKVSDHNSIVQNVQKDGIRTKIFNLTKRNRDLRIIIEYLSILSYIRSKSPNFIYFDISGFPFLLPLSFLLFSRKKIVYAAHNVSTPKGAIFGKLMYYYQAIVLTYVKNIHVFSKNQENVLGEKYKNKNILLAPLALKDYGKPSDTKKNSKITFLFFGFIRDYKRLDLLIKAAEELYLEVGEKFQIVIAGYGNDWGKYAEMIIHDELFDLTIRGINDEEIPNLFSKCHYLVLPYQDATQSGVFSVALNYRLPVLASRISAFEEFIVEGRNGFFFQKNSQESLKNLMKKMIFEHKASYQDLLNQMDNIIEQNYKINKIVLKYTKYFNKLASNE